MFDKNEYVCVELIVFVFKKFRKYWVCKIVKIKYKVFDLIFIIFIEYGF